MITRRKKVLISGASVAGPALGFWLNRKGYSVTIVERAPTICSGGYPIDIRGTALEVVRRSGMLPEVRAAHIATQRLTFVDVNGRPIGTLKPEELAGGEEGVDVELPQGKLTALPYEKTRNDLEYRFQDSIQSLSNGAERVSVSFHSGIERECDIS